MWISTETCGLLNLDYVRGIEQDYSLKDESLQGIKFFLDGGRVEKIYFHNAKDRREYWTALLKMLGAKSKYDMLEDSK